VAGIGGRWPFVDWLQNCDQGVLAMPTLLRQDGLQFFFYANEHEPKHVHVVKGDDYAKIELHTFAVTVDRMKPKDLKKALAVVKVHNHEFEERWDDWERNRQGRTLR
jgi:hypothetical protein